MKLPFKLPHKIEERNRLMGLLIGLGLAFIFALLYTAGPLKSFRNFDLDLKFRMRQTLSRRSAFKSFKPPTNKDILFLDIDDSTLEWEDTYPDDPLYYADIIKQLGKDNTGALGLVFTFEYSRPFARNVDKVYIDQAEFFKMELQTYGSYIQEDIDFKTQLMDRLMGVKTALTTPGAATSTAALAEQLSGEVFSGGLQSSYGQGDPTIFDKLLQAASFAQTKDINAIAPERESALSEPIKKAGNIFFVYEMQSYIPTPYDAKALKDTQSLHEQLAKLLARPISNRPEDPRLGQIFDAYQNLSPEELGQLIDDKSAKFPPVALAKIKHDREIKSRSREEFLRQNAGKSLKASNANAALFKKVGNVIPVYPAIGRNTAGQGVGRAEFTKDDGTVRMISPVFNDDGKLYPHLDLLLAMKYLGVSHNNVEFAGNKIILKGARLPNTKKKQDLVIPVQPNGTMLINWAGVWADTTTFKHKNFRDLWTAIYSVKIYENYNTFRTMPPDQQGAYLSSLLESEQITIQKYMINDAYLKRAKTEFAKYAKASPDESNTYMSSLDGFAQAAFSFYLKHQEFKAIPEKEKKAYLAGLSEEDRNVVDISTQLAEGQLVASEKQIKTWEKDIRSLRGKIILVGRTAEGTEEINPIPLEPRYRFLGVHANAINTIVENLFIRNLNSFFVICIFLALAVSLGLLGGIIHFKSSFVTAIVNFCIMVFVGFVYFAICIFAFASAKIDIPLLIPLALIVLTFLLVFLYRFITEEAEKNKMKSMFSTYVNKEVVDSLIDDPDKLKLGGEWVNATVFFSDVAGFTSISESLKPEELVELLNEYLTAMTDIVFQYGGTLDKYIGDAIVAVYGAPIHFPNHAINACLAALDMQKKLAEMRAVWKEQGRHELLARCGVNTGDMISGNMGSTTRFNYTVMGANVELGEHMESGGKNYNTYISITEETKKQAGDAIITRQLDIMSYHGVEKPFGVYELIAKTEDGISEDKKKGFALHEEALKLYFRREWNPAIEKFNEVFKYIPDDPPSKKAITRCEKAIADPPGPEFDELSVGRW